MLGLSCIEYFYHELDEKIYTFNNLLDLSNIISKVKVTCVDFDDVEKLRTICILLKSQWVLCTMRHVATIIENFGTVDEIDLQNINSFLLNELNTILKHLNELENYFPYDCKAKELICVYRRQIIFIKKPIEKGVYAIWSSYLKTFDKEILSFKQVLNVLSAPLLSQLQNCLNEYSTADNNEIDEEPANCASSDQFKQALRDRKDSAHGLDYIHRLIRSSGVLDKVQQCYALKNIGPLGAKRELVNSIKFSFEDYCKLEWLNKAAYTNPNDTIDNDSDGLFDNSGRPSQIEDVSDHKMDSSDHNIDSSDHNIDSSDHNIDSSDHNIDSSDHNIDSSDHNIDASDHKMDSSDHNIDSSDHNIDLGDDIFESTETTKKPVVRKIRIRAPLNTKPTEESPKNRKKKKIVLLKIDPEPVGLDNTIDSHLSESAPSGVRYLRDRTADNVRRRTSNASVSLRCPWTMAETYLVYKGVTKNMTWSTIKSAYFRQSRRTNCHIKDRWRVVNSNKVLKQSLKDMFDNDKDCQ